MIGGSLSLKVTCDNDQAYKNMNIIIDSFVRKGWIEIVNESNKNFEIRLIHLESNNDKLLQYLFYIFNRIQGVTCSKIRNDEQVWNVNSRQFVNVSQNDSRKEILLQKLENKKREENNLYKY
jgi:hypothetical protein